MLPLSSMILSYHQAWPIGKKRKTWIRCLARNCVGTFKRNYERIIVCINEPNCVIFKPPIFFFYQRRGDTLLSHGSFRSPTWCLNPSQFWSLASPRYSIIFIRRQTESSDSSGGQGLWVEMSPWVGRLQVESWWKQFIPMNPAFFLPFLGE